MLKGLYFMGWPRDMWNYHPSLPMRNMQMVEDIVDMRGDMLIWSCLGSGAIGLPTWTRRQMRKLLTLTLLWIYER